LARLACLDVREAKNGFGGHQETNQRKFAKQDRGNDENTLQPTNSQTSIRETFAVICSNGLSPRSCEESC